VERGSVGKNWDSVRPLFVEDGRDPPIPPRFRINPCARFPQLQRVATVSLPDAVSTSCRMTHRACGALKCFSTSVSGLGMPGLRNMARRIQCDQSCHWAHAPGYLLAAPRQPRSNVAGAWPGATMGAAWWGWGGVTLLLVLGVLRWILATATASLC
jgi:hypothetical protein